MLSYGARLKFFRGVCLQSQSVHTLSKQIAQIFVNKAMAGHSVHSLKARSNDHNPEVRAAAGPVSGMSAMGFALVHDLQMGRGKIFFKFQGYRLLPRH